MSNPHVQQAASEAPINHKSIADEAPSEFSDLKARFRNRPRYEFTIPTSARTRDTDPKTIEVVELTASDEEMAFKVADGNRQKQAIEMIKLSLYSVDGKPVRHDELETEFYWEQRFGPKVRQLIQIAFKEVNTSSNEEDASFLASRKVRVG